MGGPQILEGTNLCGDLSPKKNTEKRDEKILNLNTFLNKKPAIFLHKKTTTSLASECEFSLIIIYYNFKKILQTLSVSEGPGGFVVVTFFFSYANQNLFRKFDGALPLPVMKNSKTVPFGLGGLDFGAASRARGVS